MRVIIQDTYDDTCAWAAAYIKHRIVSSKARKFVLGLPTGSTPVGIYRKLVEFHQKGELSFADVITFNMDEYVGLGADDHRSYAHFMHTNFFSKIDIKPSNIHLLDGKASDLTRECREYEAAITAAGGIDLFLCGLGQDGHIAFNEPGSSLSSRTRVKTLCEDTLLANARFFELLSDVPRQALTVGVQTIMEAAEVVVVATGDKKAVALKQCIEGGVTSACTCSAIQLHSAGVVVCDEEAVSELTVKTANYFRNLHQSIDLQGNPIVDVIWTDIKETDRVMITSPHPDDDVIGVGGSMQLLPNPANVSVVYMTNGDGGLEHGGLPGTRLKEAWASLCVLGLGREAVVDGNMPFYSSNDRTASSKDEHRFEEILQAQDPHHLFVCADEDPHGTHRTCYEIIRRATKNKALKCVWLYTGAWGDIRDLKCSGTVVPSYIPRDQYGRKQLAIKMHMSQEPPVVSGGDDRSFVDRALHYNTCRTEPGRFVEYLKVVKGNTVPALL